MTTNRLHASASKARTSPVPLPEDVRDALGQQLRVLYGALAPPEPPDRLRDLIERLSQVLGIRDDANTREFREGITLALPRLRAFAVSLSKDSVKADDLVQQTMVKALRFQDKFTPGTELLAWLFTILRNEFYSSARRRSREVEDADGTYAATLVAEPTQGAGLLMDELRAALARLPVQQREALLLVGAEGMTYEETARIAGCAVGTIKSRVSRGRMLLMEFMGYQQGPSTMSESQPLGG